MRHLLPTLLLLLTATTAASADEIVLRGNYWRDRNTRVWAPEVDLAKTLPTGTTLSASYLLDAITSASVSAGVFSDEPFTELRNQIALGIAQRFGPLRIGVNYRYSSESDYWAHTGGLNASLELFQKNTILSAAFVFTHAEVGARSGPTGYTPVGHLNNKFFLLSLNQVLTRRLTLDFSLELSDEGDRNDKRSFLANPYRTVLVSGAPFLEKVPLERVRFAATAGLRYGVPLYGGRHHLVFYGKYRFYVDDWGVQTNALELRTYLGLGPIEVRVTGRYYRQGGAFFFRDDLGVAGYPRGGVKSPMCPSDTGCFTGDAKLSPFSSFFAELKLSWSLRFLDSPRMPLGRWLGAGQMGISYGHYINDNYAHRQFGDADVAGVEASFPL